MQYVVGQSATSWVMLVADDCHLETSGAAYRTGLITFFVICSLLGVPLSWEKTSGGDTLTWVGFELLHKSGGLGIFSAQVRMVCRWCQETAKAETINTSFFEERVRTNNLRGGSTRTRQSILEPALKIPCLAADRKCTSSSKSRSLCSELRSFHPEVPCIGGCEVQTFRLCGRAERQHESNQGPRAGK